MKSKKINIVDNYSLEILESIPDTKGNNLEALLYLGKEILAGVNEGKLYATQAEILLDYKYHIVPDHRASVSNDILDKLHTNESITKLVRHFIKKGTIKYGMVIDVVVMLDTYGYTEPDFNKPGYNIADYEKFVGIIKRVSLEITKQLNKLDFRSDRNTNIVEYHEVLEKYGKSMNLVYTRYPWGAGSKISNVVHNFEVSSCKNHLKGTDMKLFKKHFKEVAISLEDHNTALNTMGTKFSNSKASKDFHKVEDKFKIKLSDNIHEMVAFFKEKSPTMYVNYCKG